jgi:hypothetical protein
VHPRGAVGPAGGQERQADAVLVELPAPGVGQRRLLSFEFVQVIISRTLPGYR